MKSFKQHLLIEKRSDGGIVDAKGKAFEYTTVAAANKIGKHITLNPFAHSHEVEHSLSRSSISVPKNDKSNPLGLVNRSNPQLGQHMVALGKAAALTISKELQRRGQHITGAKQVGGNNSNKDATDVSIQSRRAAKGGVVPNKQKENSFNVSLKVQKKAGGEKLRAPGLGSLAALIDHGNSLLGQKSDLSTQIKTKTKEHEAIERKSWLQHKSSFTKVLGKPGKVNGQYSSSASSAAKDVHWHIEKTPKGKEIGVRMSRGASSKLRDFARDNPNHPAAKAYNQMTTMSRSHASEITDMIHGHLSKIFAPNPDSQRMHVQAHIYRHIQGSENMPMVVTGFMNKANKPEIHVHDIKNSVEDEIHANRKSGLPYSRKPGTASMVIGSRRIAYDRRIQGGNNKVGSNGQSHYHAFTVNMK